MSYAKKNKATMKSKLIASSYADPAENILTRTPLVARRQVPRYLFRVYSDESGYYSDYESIEGLNSETRITPHAFLDEDNLPPPFNEIHPFILAKNAERHYHQKSDWSEQPYNSLFSSWTPSLLTALSYARYKYDNNETDVAICMLDTCAVSNEMANVKTLINWDELVEALASERRELIEEEPLYHEYLIFGIISDTQSLSVVMLDDILQTDLASLLPGFDGEAGLDDPWGHDRRAKLFGYGYNRRPNPPYMPRLYPQEATVKIALEVGCLFGNRFVLPVAAGILSLSPRQWLQKNLAENSEEAEAVLQDGKGLRVLRKAINNYHPLPRDLRSDGVSFENRLLNTRLFPEIQQHMVLLRIIWLVTYQ